MNSSSQAVQKRIVSIITKSDIRYQGELHEIDSIERSVVLKDVTPFGTESRRTTNIIPPANVTYEFVKFAATDIKELIRQDEPQEIKKSVISVSELDAQVASISLNPLPNDRQKDSITDSRPKTDQIQANESENAETKLSGPENIQSSDCRSQNSIATNVDAKPQGNQTIVGEKVDGMGNLFNGDTIHRRQKDIDSDQHRQLASNEYRKSPERIAEKYSSHQFDQIPYEQEEEQIEEVPPTELDFQQMSQDFRQNQPSTRVVQEKLYDKNTSFFDRASVGSQAAPENAKQDRYKQFWHDSDTFGPEEISRHMAAKNYTRQIQQAQSNRRGSRNQGSSNNRPYYNRDRDSYRDQDNYQQNDDRRGRNDYNSRGFNGNYNQPRRGYNRYNDNDDERQGWRTQDRAPNRQQYRRTSPKQEVYFTVKR